VGREVLWRGTSREMLDKHYGRWMNDDQGQLDLLTARGPKAGLAAAQNPDRSPDQNASPLQLRDLANGGGRFELRCRLTTRS
jgi:hypothetical protein